MFEAQVAYYLNKYLGQYLQGLDADSLRISVWRGDVELRNLSLRPEALQDLDLPITVKAGLLGRLTLKVPWKALGREPVLVEFDRLYILACPKEQPAAQTAQADVAQYEADVTASELEAKRRRVLAAETRWLQDLQAKMALKLQQQEMEQQQQASAKPGGKSGGKPGSGSGGLWNVNFTALMHTILGNLQLRLTNVHVRYEDSSSLPGQQLSCGLLLGRVAAHTVDAEGREAFVTSDVLNLLRKAVSLQDLSIYFDVGAPFLEPPRDWTALMAREWDVLFSPGRHAPGAAAAAAADTAGAAAAADCYRHHFLLLPITGQMNYVRRSSKYLNAPAAAEGDDGGRLGGALCLPRQEGRVALQSLSLALSREQYTGTRALLEALDAHTANAPYRALRPPFRPGPGAAAHVWWRYALRAVRKQLRLQPGGGGGCSWEQLRNAARLRKKYVPAYARCLAATAAAAAGGGRGGGGGGLPQESAGLGGDAAIADMDAGLPEGTILVFRRMAHAMAQSQRTVAAAAGVAVAPAAGAAAAAPATAAGTAAGGRGGRTWVGWLMGAGSSSKQSVTAAAAVAAGGCGAAAPGAVEEAASLTPEEWDRLQQLLHQADAGGTEEGDEEGAHELLPGGGGGGRPAPSDPYRLTALLEVAVERCSLELRGGTAEGGPPLLSASLQATALRLLRYPATLGLSLRVGWAGLEAPQGMLLCTDRLEEKHLASDSGGPQRKKIALGDDASPTRGSSGGAGDGGGPFPSPPGCAFLMDFVRRPQDSSADATLSVRVAPSYVTYNAAAVAAVGAFFSTAHHQAGLLGNLQAQAAARVQRLQRLAQVRLRALSCSSDRPRLAVSLVMHAPKLALPDDKGRGTLLLDLGCFSLTSSSPAAQGLAPGSDEASLYECFRLGLVRVEAALVGGAFRWPAARPPLPPPLRAVAAAVPGDGTAAATFALLGPLPTAPATAVARGARICGGIGGAAAPSSPLGLAFVAKMAKEEDAAAAATATAAEAPLEDKQPGGESEPPQFTDASKLQSKASAATAAASSCPDERHDAENGGEGNLLDLVRHLSMTVELAAAPPVVVTLLPRFGLQAGLQVAMAQDPRLPAVRLRVAASPLRFEFSPWRFHRLMAVLDSLSPAAAAAAVPPPPSAAAAVAAAPPLPLWVTDAEYVTPVQLLTWEGVGGRVARWQPRSLCVWRGRVYLSREKGAGEALESRSCWRGWRLLELAPELVGGGGGGGLAVDTDAGAGHGSAAAAVVVALVPEGVRREAAAESPESLVLRLRDAREVGALRRSLTRSAALVESVAGLLGDEDEDADSPTGSSAPGSVRAAAAAGGGGPGGTGVGGGGLGVTRDLLDELLSHRDLFELSGSLPSLELRLSGRPPRAWRAIRRLALAEPPPPCSAGLGTGTASAAEISGSMYQQAESHAGTDLEGISQRGPTGSISSLSDFADASASMASSMAAASAAAKPPGRPESVGASNIAGEAVATAAVGPGPPSQHSCRVAGGSGGGSDAASDVDFADAAEYDAEYDDVDDGVGSAAAGGDGGGDDGEQLRQRLRELTLEQEVPLLAMALTSAAINVSYSADRLAVALRMQALRMDNELMVAALGSPFAVLAVSSSSSLPSGAGAFGDEGAGGAAAAAAAAGAGAVLQEAGFEQATKAEDPTAGGGGAPLVQLNFTSHSSKSNRYKGLDTELSLQLSGLALTSHRPTIAALMGLGSDLAYANSLLVAERAAAAATAAVPAEVAAPPPPEASADVVRSGGDGRTLMRLRISMARLQLVMPYEVMQPAASAATVPPTPIPDRAGPQLQRQHSQQPPSEQQGAGAVGELGGAARARLFAVAEMDCFSFCLDVRPSSLELTTALGNFTAQYGALPASSPYRTICTMRPGTSGSLIEVTFRMHSAVESLSYRSRVPSDQPFYSLSASLSAVQVVYMGRFLNELLPYITDMLAMQPRPRPPLGGGSAPTAAPPVATSTAPTPTPTPTPPAPSTLPSTPVAVCASSPSTDSPSFPSATTSSAVTLLIDVSLASPVITLPQNSASGHHVKLDLGTLRLSNVVAWRRGGAAAAAAAALAPGSAAALAGQAGGGGGGSAAAGAGVDIAGPGAEGWQVLMDEMQIRLTDMSLVVGSTDDLPAAAEAGGGGGTSYSSGQNIIHDIGAGVIVNLYRPLAMKPAVPQSPSPPPPPPPLPPLHAAVALSQLSAVISESEYRRLLAVLSGNFAEPSQSDPRVVELHQILLRLGSAAAAAPSPSPSPPPPAASDPYQELLSPRRPLPGATATTAAAGAGAAARFGSIPVPAPRSPALDFSRSLRAVLAALGDTCTVQATVAIGAARLTLLAAAADGGAAPAPLTAVGLRDFWLGYYATARGGMFLSAALPTFTIEDLRPQVSAEQRLVLSTAAAAGSAAAAATAAAAAVSAPPPPPLSSQPSPSLLALEYRSAPTSAATAAGASGASGASVYPASQALRLRLQRPTLVLDFGLLLRLVNFVAPSPVLQGATPRPYETRDIILPLHVPYRAYGRDLWLSPEVRLLADAPPAALGGGAAVLAAAATAGVGAGVVHVYDGGGGRLVLPPGLSPAESLPLIVVGANRMLKLCNVRIVNCASLPSCLTLGAGARLSARDEDGVKFLLAAPETDREYASVLAAATEAAAAAAAPPLPPHSAAAEAAASAGAAAQPPVFEMCFDALGAAVHIIEAGAGGALEENGGNGSALDLKLGVLSVALTPPPPPPRPPSRLAPGGGGDAASADSAAVAAAQRLRRRLVLQFDASAAFRVQGQQQEATAALRSLTMRAITVFPAAATATATVTATTSSHGSSPQMFKAASAATLAAGGGTAGGGPSTTITSTLLEPADVSARYRLAPSYQDLNLNLGALTLRLSPAALHLLLQLQEMVQQPLMAPPPSQPLARCARFQRLWYSHRPAAAAAGGGGGGGGRGRGLELGVGGVDSLAEERGVTVWRPQPAQGYVSLGDVITAGSHSPSCQVATLAANSGLIAFPTAFELVWTAAEPDDFALWRPLAPPGYLALGCVAGGRAAPPPLAAVGCVAARACVEARLGECRLLTDRGNLWVVQNEGATFEVSSPDAHLPAVHLYDLRSPLGVPPAALTPLQALLPSAVAVVPLGLVREASLPAGVGGLGAAAQPPPLSLLCQQRYVRNRSAIIRRAVRQASQLPCVEFGRVWWDKHAAAPSADRLSIWRPKPPPGYMFLGDCATSGIYAPPPSCVVLRDVDPAALLTDGRPPPLARPINYVRVWSDEQRERQGDTSFLVLWRPVAPAGYVPLGLVAGLGPRTPPVGLPIRCVRADLVTTETLSRTCPDWTLPAHKQRPWLAGWTADARTGTFTVLSGASVGADIGGGFSSGASEGSFSGSERTAGFTSAGSGATFDAPRIKLDVDDPWVSSSLAGGGASGGGPKAGGDGRGGNVGSVFRRTDVVVRMSRAVVLLRTSLGKPLLELDVRDTTLGFQRETPDLSRSYAILLLSVWTHSPSLGVWEPLLEPWQLLAHLDDNRASRPVAGVSSGTTIKITSTQASVQAVVAASALKSLLEALPEWTNLTSPEGLAAVRRQLSYGEAAAGGSSYGSQVAQQGLMANALGCPVSLLTDLGDRQAVVDLQPDAEDVPVLLQPPPNVAAAADSRAAGLAPPPVPSIRLFADAVSAGGLPRELLREGGLMVRIRVNGPVAELMPESAWGLYTRALDPSQQQQQYSSTCTQQDQQQPHDNAAEPGAISTTTVVRWDERFLLKLPVELSEQLLCPAPGDNQFDGVPLQLDVSLLACGAAGGPPRVVAAGTLPLQSDWLANEVDTLRNTAAAAAAAAAASGTLPVLGAAADGVVRCADGAVAAAAGATAAPSDVSETVDVRLFPTRVVRGGDGSSWKRPTGRNEAAAAGGGGGGGAAIAAAEASCEEPPLLQLRLSLDVHQVDTSWQPFLSRTRRRLPAGAGGCGGPSAASLALSGGDGRAGAVAAAVAARGGRRAVRLDGSDTWVPFGQTGGIITSGPGGDMLQASSCIPIRAGPGLVLERSPGPGGQPLELLRSLAVLHNAAGVPLEVSLVAGDPEVASWTLLAGAAKQPSPPGWQKGSAGGREAAATATAPAPPPSPVDEDVYENERFFPLLGWSHTHLLPTERRRYSRHGQSYGFFPLVPLPPGWEWEGPWQVETAGYVDPNGWFYALDWPFLKYPPTPEQARRKVTDMVRRRRWLRRRRWVGVGAKGPAAAIAGGGGLGGPPRRLLGVVAPGDRLPLPLGWEKEGVELQVRPLAAAPAAGGAGGGRSTAAEMTGVEAAEAEAQVSHEWSGGLLMSSLDEGGARLLCCKTVSAPPAATGPLGAGAKPASASTSASTTATATATSSAFATVALMPVASADEAAEAAGAAGSGVADSAAAPPLPPPPAVDPQQTAWLSVSLECEALVATSGGAGGGGIDTLVDWRLVVRPPLTLHNTLPVAGRYIVWERSGPEGALHVRQRGRVAAGATAPVFSADMRMQVYLSFAPDGCEYGESDPVLLSDGFMRNTAGVAAAPRLPDGFRCTYSHSASFYPLRINLLREVDTAAVTTGVLTTGGRPGGLLSSPGEAVAQGYPLTVSLHVPLWLVNATQLPVSCGVMALEAAPNGPEGGGGGSDPRVGVGRSDPSVAGSATGGVGGGLGFGGGQLPPHLLKIIDTEAFRNSPRPTAYVSVFPRSMELLSYPPGVAVPLLGEDGDGGSGGGGGVQVAVVLSLYGSRWTQPIYLPRPGEQMQPRLGAGGLALPSDRLLIRALCKDGCIHEVTARLDSAPLGPLGLMGAGPLGSLMGGPSGPMGLSSAAATRGSVAVLVRLEHHVLLTNSTGYPLSLIQPELAASAAAAAAEGAGGGGGSRGAYRGGAATGGGGGGGGLSFTAGSSYGNPSPALTVTGRAMSAAPGGGGSGRGGGAAAGAALSAALSLSLPPGSLGVPLHWAVPAASRRQLCLALPLAGEAAASAAVYGLPASCLWSEPIKIDLPGGQDAQVALPVYCLGPVGRYHSAHAGAAAMAALSNMTPQQQRLYELHRGYSVARQMFASLCGGGGAAGPTDAGVGPRSFRLLDHAGSGTSNNGSGTLTTTTAATGTPAEIGASGRSGSLGVGLLGPGPGLGLLMRPHQGSGGAAAAGGGGGEEGGRGDGTTSRRPTPAAPLPPSLEPNLVRIVRPTELGNVEFLAVLLNLRLALLAPGCLLLSLASLGGAPQALLHNASPLPLMWRQAAPRVAWARLEGYSCVAAARGAGGEGWGAPLELELRDTEPQSESSLLLATDLTTASGGAGGNGGGGGGGGGPYPGRPGGGGLAGGPLGSGALDLGRPVLQGVFRVGPQHREVLAHVCAADDLVLVPEGPNPLPGAVSTGLGSSRLETVVRLVVAPPPLGPAGAGPRPPAAAFVGPYLNPAALYGGGGVSSSTHVTVSVGSLELSLVDGRPEEIAVLTVEELTAELMTGRAAGLDFTHLSVRLRSAQLDDQAPGSAYPVVLQPLEQPGPGDPLFVLQYCFQPGKLRYALHCPVIAARLLPLRVSLAEPLLWRLWGAARNLVANSGTGAGGHSAPMQQISGSDVPLAIDLMVVEDLPLRLSFRSEAASRPRWAPGRLRLGLDLAKLEDVGLELPGVELERVRLPRSELMKKVYDRLQERIFSMAVAVLCSAGLMGSLSKVFAVSSAGMAQLASDGAGAGGGAAAGAGGVGGSGGSRAAAAAAGRAGGDAGGAVGPAAVGGGEVRSLQGGVVEGGRLIARGMLAGATGIFTKPVEGAERGGVTGFLGGLAKGLVGAAVQPVSGALAAVSKVTEGVDATRRNITGAVVGAVAGGRRPGVARKRLQRAFTGDSVLRPFSLHPALGQALLYSVASWLGPSAAAAGSIDPRFASGASSSSAASGSALLSLGAGLGAGLSFVAGSLPSVRGAIVGGGSSSSRPDLRRDRYEEHWVLPGAVVLLLTDRRVVSMRAPEFVAVQTSVLSGEVTPLTEVPAGDAVVLWHLPWPEMLSAELAWFRKPSDTQTQTQQGRMLGQQGRQGASAMVAQGSYGGGVPLPADGLVLHRKRRSEDDQLYYEVRCSPGTSQASDILNRLQEVRYRCHLLLRQQERGWRDSQPQQVQLAAAAAMAAAAAAAPAAAAGGFAAGHRAAAADVVLPDTVLSQDFRRVWMATGGRAAGGRSASIWRPVGPPGYVALGDVAVTGRESPPRPVRLYKDSPALAAAAVNPSGSGDAPASEVPRLAPPVGYTLIFRDSANPPLTLWKPVPPRGYTELGCVAWPEVEEPPLALVRCLRRDLVAPGRVFDAPVWTGGSSDNVYWRVGVWPVDCAAGTFVAVKGDGPPPRALVREPVF